MPDVLTALEAFLQEHRRCGELDGGAEGGRVWMAYECGAELARDAREERMVNITRAPRET